MAASVAFQEILRKLAPENIRPMPAEPGNAPGVKGLEAVRARVPLQLPADPLGQGGMISFPGLELDDERGLPLIELQHLMKLRNGFLRSQQRIPGQVLRRQVLHDTLLPGDPHQIAVMNHRQGPVLQKVHIQLNSVAGFQSVPEGGHAVFRHPLPVESPVGIVPLPEGLHPGLSPPPHDGQGVQEKQNKNYNQNNHCLSPRCKM